MGNRIPVGGGEHQSQVMPGAFLLCLTTSLLSLPVGRHCPCCYLRALGTSTPSQSVHGGMEEPGALMSEG